MAVVSSPIGDWFAHQCNSTVSSWTKVCLNCHRKWNQTHIQEGPELSTDDWGRTGRVFLLGFPELQQWVDWGRLVECWMTLPQCRDTGYWSNTLYLGWHWVQLHTYVQRWWNGEDAWVIDIPSSYIQAIWCSGCKWREQTILLPYTGSPPPFHRPLCYSPAYRICQSRLRWTQNLRTDCLLQYTSCYFAETSEVVKDILRRPVSCQSIRSSSRHLLHRWDGCWGKGRTSCLCISGGTTNPVPPLTTLRATCNIIHKRRACTDIYILTNAILVAVKYMSHKVITSIN